MSQQELSNQYLHQATELLNDGQNENAIFAIRKAIFIEPYNIFAHLKSMQIYYANNYIYHLAVAGIHSVYGLEHHGHDVPEKWLNLTLYGLSRYKLAIEFYKMGDSNAEPMFYEGLEYIRKGYTDHREYFEQVFPYLMPATNSVMTLQKTKVESSGQIPFKMYSGIKDYRSNVSSEAVAQHIQSKINLYGHFEIYVIHDLEQGRVERLDPLMGIKKWHTNADYGTSGIRMLMASSKGSLMLQYGNGGTILPSVLQVYESFMRIESKSFNNYAHTFFIEAKNKNGSTLTIALVDPITHAEGHAAEVINQLYYIKNVLEK